MSPKLQSLSTLCLEEQKEFLLEELEPKYLCDLLLEERAIEIMIHDKITEITDRRPQIIALLQTLQKNENECFHYFLYIIEKTEFDSIRCEFESLASFGSARDGMFKKYFGYSFGVKTIFKRNFNTLKNLSISQISV